jgi:hypothetical protein
VVTAMAARDRVLRTFPPSMLDEAGQLRQPLEQVVLFRLKLAGEAFVPL